LPAVAKKATGQEGGVPIDYVRIWCPGCDHTHVIPVDRHGAPGITWEWDGSLDAPTISPSLLIVGTQWPEEFSFYKPTHHVAPGEQIRCHSFIRDGHIEMLTDSTHHLAGQTVPLLPVDQWPY